MGLTRAWEWDLGTDEMVFDETMKRLFGVESGTFEGTFDTFLQRVHPDDRSDVETAVEESIEAEKQLKRRTAFSVTMASNAG